jgi:hypothetical protein
MFPVVRIQCEVLANPHGGVPFCQTQVPGRFGKGVVDYLSAQVQLQSQLEFTVIHTCFALRSLAP